MKNGAKTRGPISGMGDGLAMLGIGGGGSVLFSSTCEKNKVVRHNI